MHILKKYNHILKFEKKKYLPKWELKYVHTSASLKIEWKSDFYSIIQIYEIRWSVLIFLLSDWPNTPYLFASFIYTVTYLYIGMICFWFFCYFTKF